MTFLYYGNNGNNSFAYRGSDNLIAEGFAGKDRIWGGSYNDRLYGGSGNDTLLGRAGNDFLVGDSGSDRLVGGSGRDTLRGFSGGYSREIDVLAGGTGSDTFMLGDSTGMFYLRGRTANGKDASYALITDWTAVDRIRAYGSSSSYELVKNKNLLGSSAKDTGIYVGNDLIGVIQDSTNVSFSKNFAFV
ncbi:calcium-binding protein [Leptolyngbya sp. FACHB-671]|uniref:calcium-binding protein n=1 Tax=Leptolyngbya sp. FACHB-671 TaxID=2692812 RepID=UPI00168554A2|nr:calcium-binding protein [Leptolyngbya sp. FACHB-671]MBD2069528.1 calcium-binding protein [Leptolyngbya sp. FACHB-671]